MGEDKSIIEVALVICDESNKKLPTVEVYHSFVKPKRNKGKIYPRIRELTGITQKQINSGKTFDAVMRELEDRINKYKISAIYTWDVADRRIFEWNCIGDKIPSKSKVIGKFKNYQTTFMNQIKINKEHIALSNAAYICGCKERPAHNAKDDALTLRDIYHQAKNGQFNKKKRNDYLSYVNDRHFYNMLSIAVDSLNKKSVNPKFMITGAMEGKDFPGFKEYEETLCNS